VVGKDTRPRRNRWEKSGPQLTGKRYLRKNTTGGGGGGGGGGRRKKRGKKMRQGGGPEISVNRGKKVGEPKNPQRSVWEKT